MLKKNGNQEKKRMNFDNICIISNDWVNEDTYLDDEIIIKFSELNCRNVVILTQNKKIYQTHIIWEEGS